MVAEAEELLLLLLLVVVEEEAPSAATCFADFAFFFPAPRTTCLQENTFPNVPQPMRSTTWYLLFPSLSPAWSEM